MRKLYVCAVAFWLKIDIIVNKDTHPILLDVDLRGYL
mgnify:FL=1